MPDDELGTVAVSVVVAEVKWTPDVAPAVMDRISRDAVTYPEHFDRRAAPPTVPRGPGTSGRSNSRTVGRLLVFGVVIAVVAALIVVAVQANAAQAADSDTAAIELLLEPFADGLEEPVFVAASNDGGAHLYGVEKTGRVRVIDADGSVRGEPFLDLSESIVGGFEQGLLGLAFHPDYPSDGRFFVNYTRAPDGATVVSEWQAEGGVVDPGSERIILIVEQPASNHNGGSVVFDADGYLLVGMGDGGGGGDTFGSGSNPSTLLGKLLRLDVDSGEPYAIPVDNGFAATDAHRPEIHAKGLRNPWRFSVDPVGGHVYIGDVGQRRWEEVDVMPRGIGGFDFGWSEVEGPECFRSGCDLAAYTPPAVSYGHDQGCSIVGGYVYRGAEQALLDGIYLFGDYCSGRIWGASAEAMLDGQAPAQQMGSLDGTLVSFGVDEAGEIYVVDQDGRILHVVAKEIM